MEQKAKNRKIERSIMNLYRLNYFLQGLFLTFSSTYLPIFLRNVKAFSPTNITAIVLITQFPPLLKPLIGILSEKFGNKTQKRLPLIISTAIYGLSGLILAILLFSISLTGFIILLLFMYLTYAIFDTYVDWLIVEKSHNRNEKVVVNFQIFNQIGSLIIIQLYIIVIGTHIQTNSWQSFFVIFGIVGALFCVTAIIFRENTPEMENNDRVENLSKDLTKYSEEQKKILKKTAVLVVIYICIMQIPILADYIFEPYLIEQFGLAAFVTFSNIYFYSSLISLPIYALFFRYREWMKPRRTKFIIGVGFYAMANWIAVGTGPFTLILVFAFLGGAISHILNFCFLSMLIDCTPPKHKATWYQFYALIYAVISYLYRAMGILIEASIGGNLLFIVIGICLFANLPILLLINIDKFQEIMYPKKN